VLYSLQPAWIPGRTQTLYGCTIELPQPGPEYGVVHPFPLSEPEGYQFQVPQYPPGLAQISNCPLGDIILYGVLSEPVVIGCPFVLIEPEVT